MRAVFLLISMSVVVLQLAVPVSATIETARMPDVFDIPHLSTNEVIAKLSSADAEVRVAAVDELAQRNAKDAMPALQNLVADPDEEVSTAAAAAVFGMGDNTVLELLNARLKSSNQMVAIRAAEALAKAGNPAGLDYAKKVLSTDYGPISLRSRALEAVCYGADSATAYDALERAAKVPGLQLKAVGLLGSRHEKRAVDILASVRTSDTRLVRSLVAYALGGTRMNDAIALLIDMVEDADRTVANVAIMKFNSLTGRSFALMTSTGDAPARKAALLSWWNENQSKFPSGAQTPVDTKEADDSGDAGTPASK
jgi:HEAT repeat protein